MVPNLSERFKMPDHDNHADLPENDLPEEKLPAKSSEKSHPVGFFRSYLAQVKEILISPKTFFAEMDRSPGASIVPASVFLCLSAGVYAILQAIALTAPFAMISLFMSSVIGALVGSFFLNLILSKMGGQGNFKSTFRVIAYSKATLLFAWLALGPFPVGGIASLIYGIYLNILGLEKTQKLDRKKLAAVVIGLSLLGLAVKKFTHF